MVECCGHVSSLQKDRAGQSVNFDLKGFSKVCITGKIQTKEFLKEFFTGEIQIKGFFTGEIQTKGFLKDSRRGEDPVQPPLPSTSGCL